MTFRLSSRTAVHNAYQHMLAFSNAAHESSGFDRNLLELVHLRASQISGCAYCLAMHTQALREAGEREDRLAVLSAWRECDWFSDRERAALAWAEAVTMLENREVPDDVFAQARAQFSERELADLTLSVVVINGWNRLNVAFHNPPEAFTIDARAEQAAD